MRTQGIARLIGIVFSSGRPASPLPNNPRIRAKVASGTCVETLATRNLRPPTGVKHMRAQSTLGMEEST